MYLREVHRTSHTLLRRQAHPAQFARERECRVASMLRHSLVDGVCFGLDEGGSGVFVGHHRSHVANDVAEHTSSNEHDYTGPQQLGVGVLSVSTSGYTRWSENKRPTTTNT